MSEAIYDIKFDVDRREKSVNPTVPLRAGTFGDNEVAKVTFNIAGSTEGKKYRIEVEDGGGAYDITELLDAENGQVSYLVPSAWTTAGVATLRLIEISVVGNEEDTTFHYPPVYLSFADKDDGASDMLPRWQAVMTRLETSVEGAEASAKEAGNRAYLAAESATMTARLAEESQRSAERAATAAATVKKGDKGDKGEKGDKGDPGESPSEEALDAILAMQNALIGDGEILESHYGMVDISVESVDGTTKNFRLYGREVV